MTVVHTPLRPASTAQPHTERGKLVCSLLSVKGGWPFDWFSISWRSKIIWEHQNKVNESGSNTQSSQTLRATSPVLPSTSRCSQTPLELSKVLWDWVRAFSGAPESTWSYGGAFKMLWDLTYRRVKFRNSGDLCADLRETSRATVRDTSRGGETAAQHSGAGDLVPYSHSCGSSITTRYFVISYASLLQSQDSLHHNMACIILVSRCMYIRSIWPQMVVEHNQRSS